MDQYTDLKPDGSGSEYASNKRATCGMGQTEFESNGPMACPCDWETAGWDETALVWDQKTARIRAGSDLFGECSACKPYTVNLQDCWQWDFACMCCGRVKVRPTGGCPEKCCQHPKGVETQDRKVSMQKLKRQEQDTEKQNPMPVKAIWDGMLFLGDKSGHELNTIGDDWYTMEVLVGSGACETVMPVDMAKHSRIQEPPGSNAAREYEVASGAPVEHAGERRCMVSTEGSDEDKLMISRWLTK